MFTRLSTLRLASLTLPLVAVACTDSSTCDHPTTTPTMLSIAPDPIGVATCRSQPFTATTDATDPVMWSVAGGGTIEQTGLYHAPIAVPDPAAATVTAQVDGLSDTAAVTLATAFPEAARDIATATSGASHVHGFAAKGSRAYALVESDGQGGAATLAIARSDDGGQTWKPAVALAGSGGNRVTSVAIDAGDPDTVYVVTKGEADAPVEGLVELGVSIDAGATFTWHALYQGGTSEAPNPDVISPAAGIVVASATGVWIDAGNSDEGGNLMIWQSDAKGAHLGALAAFDNGYNAQKAPGTVFHLGAGHAVAVTDDSSQQLATNGAGRVCLTATDATFTDKALTLTCSTDSGATWSPPSTIVAGPVDSTNRNRIAMGHDGKLLVATWNAYVSSVDSIGSQQFRVSTDGGATWGAIHVLPDDATLGPLATLDAETFIDKDDVIWFSRTLDFQHVQFDKTCDLGTTLSGAIVLDVAQHDFVHATMFESSAGLYVAGQRLGTDDGRLAVRILTP